MSLQSLLYNFYSTKRSNPKDQQTNLNDGGGPFGFDIHFAIEVDYIIKQYGCDAFIETGTCLGDTIDYISKMYPNIDALSCEVEQRYVFHTRLRLSNRKNVRIFHERGVSFLSQLKKSYHIPFYYLDAHFTSDSYPAITEELREIDCGIVCIGDFFIGENYSSLDNYELKCFYGYDFYNNKFILDKNLVYDFCNPSTEIYTNNPLANYPLPSHQYIRKSGRAYFGIGVDEDKFKNCEFIRKICY